MSKRFPTEDLVAAKRQEVMAIAKMRAAMKELEGEPLNRKLRQIRHEYYNGGWTDDGNVRRHD